MTEIEIETKTTSFETNAPERAASVEGEAYVACYPYESNEIGDLTFTAGEYINVIKKDGDWWTGVVGDRTGIFPSNYVQPTDANSATTDDTTYYSPQQTVNTQNYSDDARNQEDVDTEVSEINTQPKSESVQDNYNRPMSTSSTTSVNILIIFL